MDQEISGHGTFIYDVQQTIGRYGSVEGVIAAIKECYMQHAWVRIHGVTMLPNPEPTKILMTALRNNNIAVAGWGWCQGSQIENEIEIAAAAIQEFGITHYIADIEDGVNNSKWTVGEIKSFLKGIRERFTQLKIGVSSFGFIPYHRPELMKAVDSIVDFFAPQIYWFRHPSQKILNSVGETPSNYPLDSAASYANLCISQWKKVVSKPLVVTGQTYWGEVSGYDQSIAEQKLKSFINHFQGWKNIQGLNWWHLGGKGQDAMSFAMFQTIKNAKLNSQFNDTIFLPPQPITSPPTNKLLTISQYAEQSALDKTCTTEGVKKISFQIFEKLKIVMGNELVSCEDFVEVVGPSAIPYLQPAAAKALKKAVVEFGEKPKLLHAYRTIAQQYVLYYWFKKKNCKITLAAPIGSSPHEQAIAIDIQENAKWRKVLAKHNWKWRGPTDPGHFTYIGGRLSDKIRKEGTRAFQNLWNENNPNDLIQEDGIYGETETGPRLRKSPSEGW